MKRADSPVTVLLDNRGQATLDLVVSSLFVIAVLAGSSKVLQLQWQQRKCLTQLFEDTREAMNQSERPVLSWTGTRIHRNDSYVEGARKCGRKWETVRFRTLDDRDPE